MIKLSIKADQLALFYALDSIPTQNGSFLTATQEGREYLLDIADNLYDVLSYENNVLRIATDEDIFDAWLDFIEAMIENSSENLYDDYFDQNKRDFKLSPNDIKKQPIEVSKQNLKKFVKFLDKEIEKAYSKLKEDNYYSVPDSYSKIASEALEDAIYEIDEYDLDYINETNRIDDILNFLKEELSPHFNDQYVARILFRDKVIEKYPLEKFSEDLRENEAIHYEIRDFLDNFREILNKATIAMGKNEEDNSVFEELVVAIDKIVQMSHHGGPLLEYALESPETIQDINAIVHSKSSPYFTEWVRKKELLPIEAEKALETHENLSLPISNYNYSDKYYKDPKFKNRQEWEKQNVPEYRRLQKDRNANELAYMNAAEVWDMSQKIMQEIKKELEELDKTGNIPNNVNADLTRLRDMENWSRNYLGYNIPNFKFSSKLLNIANKIDCYNPSLSDKIDKFVSANIL